MVMSLTWVLTAAAVLLVQSDAADKPAPVLAKTAREKAEALFQRYVDLEHAFDPAAADLYANDALIKNRRIYPNGKVREMTLPAPRYRDLIRAAMPLAKARADTNKYTDLKYSTEGQRVRIDCTRFSNVKKYKSPLSLLVGPAPDGKWLIYEEISESRP